MSYKRLDQLNRLYNQLSVKYDALKTKYDLMNGPTEPWSRGAEIEEYRKRRGITWAQAIEELVNHGLSHTPENLTVPLTEKERRVWAVWNTPECALHASPVKYIAAKLGMTPADVAFIVYPAEQFGVWEDKQEPDLTPED